MGGFVARLWAWGITGFFHDIWMIPTLLALCYTTGLCHGV